MVLWILVPEQNNSISTNCAISLKFSVNMQIMKKWLWLKFMFLLEKLKNENCVKNSIRKIVLYEHRCSFNSHRPKNLKKYVEMYVSITSS